MNITEICTQFLLLKHAHGFPVAIRWKGLGPGRRQGGRTQVLGLKR